MEFWNIHRYFQGLVELVENPKELKNPDHCYYLSFAILQLNTDLHRDEVDNKMTLKQFIDNVGASTGNEKIDPKYLENIYNKVQTDPLVIPGQKLSGSTKNKKELIQEEKKNIMESTFYQLNTITNISSNYNYVIDIDKYFKSDNAADCIIDLNLTI